MKTDDKILLKKISTNYQVELSFFNHLHDLGLIEIEIMEQSPYIHENQMPNLERMIRLHNDLKVNPEGIDVIFNLLEKIDHLQKELMATHNRLRLFDT